MSQGHSTSRRQIIKQRFERTRRLLQRLGFQQDSYLIPLAVFIAIFTGLGSVGFSKLIEAAHNFCYQPDSGLYGGREIMLLLLPAAGALLVGVITFFFAREAKGHGVPEVMDAIARRDGAIRGRVAIAKAIASALTIGSGGSAGTEGPIIQIGAAIGSATGQSTRLAKHHMPVLVGCGAAAGIAAIFHAPIAGVLFALEVFLREINFRTFSPVLMASVLSSVITYALMGKNEAIFPLVDKTGDIFHWSELGNYVLLGLLCAGAAVLFIKALYAFEDFFDWLKVHYIVKPVIGAVGLGLVGLLTIHLLGGEHIHEPSVFGNGYPLIARCIGAKMTEGISVIHLSIGALLLLFVLKTLATCLTLGSGGSGGVFAPSLFLGATIGYAFGLAVQQLPVFAGIDPATYALVGMAAVVGATTHAPITAIIILFEMTRNYQVIVPVMFAVTVALAVAQLLQRDSIYTFKLRRRGVYFENRANTAILRRMTVGMVMEPRHILVYHDQPLQEAIQQAHAAGARDWIVVDHAHHYQGLITTDDLRAALLQPEAIPLMVAEELVRPNIPVVFPDETLDVIFDRFARFDVDCLPVQSRQDRTLFLGMVTRGNLMRRYQQELSEA